jgi:hypothetical protein
MEAHEDTEILKQNKLTEVETILLRIREIPSSNQSCDTTHPESRFWRFSSITPGQYVHCTMHVARWRSGAGTALQTGSIPDGVIGIFH